MEIKQIQAVEGANVYSYRPIIRAIVDLQEWAGKSSNELGDFNLRLVETLPTLADHYCAKGRPGGFLERLEEGTLLGHVIEHVAIELLTLAGQNIPYGKTMSIPESPGEYEIIYNYESKEGAILAFKQAFSVVNSLLESKSIDIEGIVALIKREIADTELGVSTRAIVEACKRRGIPVQRLSEGSLLQLGYGRNQRRVQAAMTDHTSCIGVDIACDKGLTKKLLAESGVPVPLGYVVRTEDEAIRAFNEIKSLGVVKPYNGNQGKGVSLRLETEAEVRAAFKLAQVFGDQVIVEEYIKGRNYRLLVIGGRLVAASERVPAHVAGDGISTIQELVEKANQDPARGEDHEKALTKIKIDPVVILTLAQKKLSVSSVPQAGEIVFLRDSANLSTGGIAHDVTDIVHPDNIALVEYAAEIIGLDIAGIDFVLEDIQVSWQKQNGKIIEVNAAPGIRMHHFPATGKSMDIGKIIVDQVIPTGNGRIPIVSITGTNGKTTTTRMIGKMLLDRKLMVGTTTTDGIYIGNKLLLKGDTTGPDSARIVLRHPDVQVAVLETARGGLLRSGLAYDYADVAVITNVANDHLGQYGIETLEELAHVKSLVAEVVKPHSYVILNADDPFVVQMALKTKGRIIFFSTEKDNIHVRKHLGLGGAAVFVRRGYIIFCQGSQTYKICSVKQIPITWGGKAKHNVQNALAAVAAGWALGLTSEDIRRSLEEFTSNSETNRGRLNLYEISGVKVFVDYGHNAAGIEQVIGTLKKLKGRSLVGCITVPGDRTDETIREVARVAAKGFDRLIVKEDADLRGRKPGEVAKLLYDEVIASGMTAKQVSVVLPELEAFKHGLDSCLPRDIYVVFYENLEPIEEEIKLRLKEEKQFPPAEAAIGI
ncbi:MAG: cyanophycin synthetase [Desulfitobacterium hafniense]|nr:cyanophycin synthetase [Desulfitobacterium hafniense]